MHPMRRRNPARSPSERAAAARSRRHPQSALQVSAPLPHPSVLSGRIRRHPPHGAAPSKPQLNADLPWHSALWWTPMPTAACFSAEIDGPRSHQVFDVCWQSNTFKSCSWAVESTCFFCKRPGVGNGPKIS